MKKLLFILFATVGLLVNSAYGSQGGTEPFGKVCQAEELLKGKEFLGNKPIKKDFNKAVALLNEVIQDTEGSVSNQASRANALNLLAYCHLDGLGVKKNQAKAAELFEASGKLGKCLASSDAAMCYALGLGVGKDEKKA